MFPSNNKYASAKGLYGSAKQQHFYDCHFLLQFSPFDGCKRVNQLKCSGVGNHTLRTFVINSLIHICQKEKIARKIPVKAVIVGLNDCTSAMLLRSKLKREPTILIQCPFGGKNFFATVVLK